MLKKIKNITYEDVRLLASRKNRTSFLHLPESIKLLYFKVSNSNGGEAFRTLLFEKYLNALTNELTSSVLEKEIKTN